MLEEKLAVFRGAMLLVSHDRKFLDHLCSQIIEIRDGRLQIYRGNYSDYRWQQQAAFQRQLYAYQQYMLEKKRLF